MPARARVARPYSSVLFCNDPEFSSNVCRHVQAHLHIHTVCYVCACVCQVIVSCYVPVFQARVPPRHTHTGQEGQEATPARPIEDELVKNPYETLGWHGSSYLLGFLPDETPEMTSFVLQKP